MASWFIVVDVKKKRRGMEKEKFFFFFGPEGKKGELIH